MSNILPVSLLLPHVATILELIQRCLADSDRTESTVRLAVGLIGDLADSFPKGEIKQLLLVEWIATELRAKGRGQSPETKRTIKWARDVSLVLAFTVSMFLTPVYRSSSVLRHNRPSSVLFVPRIRYSLSFVIVR